LNAHLSGPPFERPANAPSNLARVIRSFADKYPGGRFTEIDQAGQRISVSNAKLYHRALEILHELQEQTPADPSDIVLCFESALDFVPAAWACIFGGYSCMPWQILKFGSLSAAVQAKADLIKQRLDRPVLVTTSKLRTRILETHLALFEKAVCVDEIPSRPANADLRSMIEAGVDISNPGKGGFLIPTSGTMAGPKIVIVANQDLLNRFISQKSRPGKRSAILTLPFDTISSLGIILPSHPNSYYLQTDRFTAQPLEFFSAIEEFQIETFGLSSSLAARLSDAADNSSRSFDLSSLEHMGFGAEMIVPKIVKEFGDRIQQMGARDLKVSFGYGMTETGLICCTKEQLLDKALLELEHDHPPVSIVGSCMQGWSLRIVDDGNAPIPPGRNGNIEVWSADKMFAGYHNDPALTEASFTPDGWFKTGDCGLIENDALNITGRQKAMIIVNGRNVSLEEIEAPLREMEGIRHALVAAVPVRQDDSTTDELAVFFVPQSDVPECLEALCRDIFRATARTAGIGVKHLVPLMEADFSLTSTGKIRRDELAASYQSGCWQSMEIKPAGRSEEPARLTACEEWLSVLWKKTLKLEYLPSREENFYDLGGDSLASAALIFAVEEHYACVLPIELFFQTPTIATLSELIGRDRADLLPESAQSEIGGIQLLHQLQSYTGSWQGARLFPESLVVGTNVTGAKPPLFWVFQEYDEFARLGQVLGPDQPLYGMRSCVGMIGIRDYTAEFLETICNRYLWEILALPIEFPIIVGGNCQGGILALALARKLRQIGRPPQELILMEWSYSYGPYDGPVRLLYGAQSNVAEIYTDPQSSSPDWRKDFPHNSVTAIPGGHGEFFGEANISGLVKALNLPETRKYRWFRF